MVELHERPSAQVGAAEPAAGFKMTELGELPIDWKVVSLGSLVEQGAVRLQNGFSSGVHNQEGHGVPHLRPFNISSDGTVDLEQIKFVGPPAESAPYWLKPGDVIFNNTNSEELVGKTALLELEGRRVLSNHMTIIRVLDESKLEPYYLARIMH